MTAQYMLTFARGHIPHPQKAVGPCTDEQRLGVSPSTRAAQDGLGPARVELGCLHYILQREPMAHVIGKRETRAACTVLVCPLQTVGLADAARRRRGRMSP